MNNLALQLIEYVKNDVDQNVELKDLYKSLMYALSDGDYVSALPRFDHKAVEDAWNLCEARFTLLDPAPHYYDEVIPEYLLQVEGIKEYFTDLVLYEIEQRIDKVFPDNYEYIESEAIEAVIDKETHEHAWRICKDFTDTMKEESGERYSISIGSSSKNPAIITITNYNSGQRFDAVLTKKKIEEIYNCYWGDYDTIEFDWEVR